MPKANQSDRHLPIDAEYTGKIKKIFDEQKEKNTAIPRIGLMRIDLKTHGLQSGQAYWPGLKIRWRTS
jgi:hypothetical protein